KKDISSKRFSACLDPSSRNNHFAATDASTIAIIVLCLPVYLWCYRKIYVLLLYTLLNSLLPCFGLLQYQALHAFQATLSAPFATNGYSLQPSSSASQALLHRYSVLIHSYSSHLLI